MQILEEYLNESIFGKKVFYISDKRLSQLQTKNYDNGYLSIKLALGSYININNFKYKYYDKKNKITNDINDATKIIFDNHNINNPNTKYYLYYLNPKDYTEISKYGCNSDKTYITIKKTEEYTLEKLCKKAGLKMELVDFSSIPKNKDVNAAFIRKQISFFKSSLNEFPDIKKGFTVSDYYNDNIEDFATKQINEIEIMDYDLWDIDDKAKQNYEEIDSKITSFLNYLNKNISDKRFKFDYGDGDWDSGSIVLKYK